jgi:hypothetical protein
MEKVIRSFLCASLLLLSCTSLSFAEDCLEASVLKAVHPSLWQTVQTYFRTLSPTDPASRSAARLLELRATVLNYESAKQRLIEILEAHLRNQVSGGVVSDRLQLTTIPDVIDRIKQIGDELESFEDDNDLFVAEKPFKDLVVTIGVKRAITLCNLRSELDSSSPDPGRLQLILKDLKDELMTISQADDALGDYIKRVTK